MKNKTSIIFIVQLIIIIIATCFYNVQASNYTEYTETLQVADKGATSPADNPDTYKPKGLDNADQVKDIGNKIIGIVQFIGSFASVIVLVVLGIKYMSGSVEEKAEYKKTMVPYLIGAIMVFGITNLLGIINSVTDGLF